MHLAELAHHFFEAARGGDARQAAEFARRAADEAVRSLAYEEAARLYHMALQAFELEGSTDEVLHAELLLALGDARGRAGDLSSASEAFLRAAGIARRTGEAAQLARAALGYGGRFVWTRAGSDPHVIALLQDALVLLGGSDDRLRIRLLARLACALRDSPDREHSDALSKQAVEIARQLNDLPTLGYALVGRAWAIFWPEELEKRFELAADALRVAEQANDGERIFDAQLMTCTNLIDAGAIAEAEAEIEAVARRANELRQPSHRWASWALRSSLALLQGEFDRAEKLMEMEVRPGLPTNPVRDDVSANRFHRFLLARERGRVDDIEAAVRTSVQEFPWYPLHQSALACLLIDMGRANEARAVFNELKREDFTVFHRDSAWLLGMALASEACALLGDREAAAVLYEKLLPFAGRHAVGHAEGSAGAMDRYLGLLATTLGRVEEAAAHFEGALLVNERMGAQPWVAHTQHDFARMLLTRDGPGDRERALELLGSCLQTCRELGMLALERKTASFLADVGEAAPAPTAPSSRPSPGPSVFRREGEYFSIAFESDPFRLKDSKGLRYLALMLARPGEELHALDLVAGEGGLAAVRQSVDAGELTSSFLGDAGEILDDQAKAAYKRRMIDLEEEMEEAEAFGDTERAARARDERDFLARELASAVGLGGRNRVAASASERARVNVTRAIRASLARIAEHNPALGKHLDATVRTGIFCSYTPDLRMPPSWRV